MLFGIKRSVIRFGKRGLKTLPDLDINYGCLLYGLPQMANNCRVSGLGPPQERGVKGGSAPLEATFTIDNNQNVYQTKSSNTYFLVASKS